MTATTKPPPPTYESFLAGKRQLSGDHGFDPEFMPDQAFPFQRDLIEFACRKGRSAIFADCGLGKTLIQLAWAENVAAHTGQRVLILTPLAVSHQTVAEAEKFGIECARSADGKIVAQITVTNYERLHYFSPDDFAGVVCDESSILKNFDGTTRAAITEFMRARPYRLLCTATASPNDYVELGTSSEAIGELGFMDMIGRFFKKTGSATSRRHEMRSGMYQFRGHAERDFWRWVCSWARAVRRPSDLGYDDGDFHLPELRTETHFVEAATRRPGMLFDAPAQGLREQREERARTLTERCEAAAAISAGHDLPAVAWCNLNKEGDLLQKLIPGSVQVSGSDSDEKKEEAFRAFERGEIRVMVTKPSIAGFGLNWQHCSRQTWFPSHSYEQYYQAVRRSWRFGQTRGVTIDIICTEGERAVLENLRRKSAAADRMFTELVEMMRNELRIQTPENHLTEQQNPSWLSTKK